MGKNSNLAISRDMLLFGETYDESKYRGGTRSFRGLNIETARKLVDLELLNEDTCYNSAPSVGEILDFMEEYPDFTAFGYADSMQRSCVEIIIEGVESDKTPETLADAADFIGLFRFADDFYLDPPYAWYD